MKRLALAAAALIASLSLIAPAQAHGCEWRRGPAGYVYRPGGYYYTPGPSFSVSIVTPPTVVYRGRPVPYTTYRSGYYRPAPPPPPAVRVFAGNGGPGFPVPPPMAPWGR